MLLYMQVKQIEIQPTWVIPGSQLCFINRGSCTYMAENEQRIRRYLSEYLWFDCSRLHLQIYKALKFPMYVTVHVKHFVLQHPKKSVSLLEHFLVSGAVSVNHQIEKVNGNKEFNPLESLLAASCVWLTGTPRTTKEKRNNEHWICIIYQFLWFGCSRLYLQTRRGKPEATFCDTAHTLRRKQWGRCDHRHLYVFAHQEFALYTPGVFRVTCRGCCSSLEAVRIRGVTASNHLSVLPRNSTQKGH